MLKLDWGEPWHWACYFSIVGPVFYWIGREFLPRRFPDRPKLAWFYRKTFCRAGFHWWHRWDDHRGRGKVCDVNGCRAYRSWWERR
jgi:hypothetical protein